MDTWIQWVVGVVVALAGVFAGRFWEKNDRQIKKDKELIEKIITLIPVDGNAISFLRMHDFASSYQREYTKPFWELRRLLNQPNCFFINKKLEEKRKELQEELFEFENLVAIEVFASEKQDGYFGVDNPYVIIRFIKQAKKNDGEVMSDEEVEHVMSHHKKTVDRLNLLSSNISDIYDSLISIAHRKL